MRSVIQEIFQRQRERTILIKEMSTKLRLYYSVLNTKTKSAAADFFMA